MNWKRLLKGAAMGIGGLILILVLVVAYQVYSFNSDAARVRDAPTPDIVAVADSAIIARGEHIASSFGGCRGCHGDNLAGTEGEDLGPIGLMGTPNLTRGAGGVGSDYTDQELARAIRYGVRRDGTSLLFMPTEEHNWWPDSDLQAVVSYVRSVPPVDAESRHAEVGLLGKLLTRFGVFNLFSAEAPHAEGVAPSPAPTAAYGAFLARGCAGCHGKNFAGGPIPGAPGELAKPANLTLHESGLAGWTLDDFIHTLNTGTRPDGTQLDPFMPIRVSKNLSPMEKEALWNYLQSLEPVPYGARED